MKYKQLWLLWLRNLVLSFTDLASGSDQEQQLMGFRKANYANDTALQEPQDVGKLIYSGHFRSRLPVGGTFLAASYCLYPFLWLKLPCKAVHDFWIEPPSPILCFFHSLKAAWACSVRAAWHSTHLLIHSISLWKAYIYIYKAHSLTSTCSWCNTGNQTENSKLQYRAVEGLIKAKYNIE